MKGDELLIALGKPEKSGSDSKSADGYWSGKSAELKGYLMDAVDSSLSKEERAKALCQALEAHGEPAEEEEVPSDEEEAPAAYDSYED